MVYIDNELCKSCKICIRLCPRKVFEIGDKANKKGYNYAQAVRQESCVMCRLCENGCPDFAIYVQKD